MPIHTDRANGRTAHRPVLTSEEATELAEMGFRFSIFSPESGAFQLSLPLSIAEDRVHETLTFMQDDEPKPQRRLVPREEPIDLLDTF